MDTSTRVAAALLSAVALAPASPGTATAVAPGCGGGGTPAVCGSCSFSALLTTANRMIVNYWGTATATPRPGQEAVQTEVLCEISNGTLSQAWSTALPGPFAATADSTLLALPRPQLWPVTPVTICVEATAWFANPTETISMPRRCQ